MSLASPGRLVVAVLLPLLAGCVGTIATTAERDASFSPYAAQAIGGVSLHDYLLARSALLLVGDPSHPAIGYATAVDARGYYLTAAHCLTAAGVQLAVPRGAGGADLDAVEVVWCGDPAQHEPDVAILYDPRPPLAAFAWARTPRTDGVVFAVGPNYTDAPAGQWPCGCVAGRLVGLLEPDQGGPAARRLVHTAPVHPGDSGGPLVTAEGELLGINVESETRLQLDLQVTRRGRAYRPDLRWLRQTIEEDFVRRTRAAAYRQRETEGFQIGSRRPQQTSRDPARS